MKYHLSQSTHMHHLEDWGGGGGGGEIGLTVCAAGVCSKNCEKQNSSEMYTGVYRVVVGEKKNTWIIHVMEVAQVKSQRFKILG